MGDTITRKLSIIFAVLALGCEGSNAVVPYGNDASNEVVSQYQPAESCSRDSDCKAGMGCSGSPGVCVPIAQSETYNMQITPGSKSDYLPIQFANVVLGGSLTRFTMVKPVELRGTAAIQTKDGINVASGLLVAQANSQISFITMRSETKVSKIRSTDGTTFGINLFPGIEYNLAFIPDTDNIPPYTFTDTLMKSKEVNILLPEQSKYHQVEGILTRQADSGKISVKDAVVRSSWGGFVSGPQTTTDENGYFSLLTPPQVTSVKLDIRAGNKKYFTPITIQEKTDTKGLIKLSVQGYRPTHSLTIQVVGADKQVLVHDAFVKVMSENDTNIASGTTDSNGVIHLDIPEGDFLLEVTSPGGSPFESAMFKLKVMSDSEQPFVVLLDKRPCVDGSVHGNTGIIPDAKITLIPASDAGGRGLRFTDKTDESGNFRLCLDPGKYSLLVEPPQGSDFARFSDIITMKQPFGKLDINLPHGVLIRGVVQQEDGNPIPLARVDFFFRSTHKELQTTVALPYTTMLAATTLTNDKGEFSAVVPHISKDAEGAFGMPNINMKQK